MECKVVYLGLKQFGYGGHYKEMYKAILCNITIFSILHLYSTFFKKSHHLCLQWQSANDIWMQQDNAYKCVNQ